MQVSDAIRILFDRVTALEASSGNVTADPQRLGSGREGSFRSQVIGLHIGRISDACHALRAYRVDTGTAGTIVCGALTFAGGDLTVSPGYAVNDMVVVVASRGSGMGYIIGKAPSTSLYGDAEARSFITLSDNFSPDAFYNSYLEMIGENDERDIPSWTPGAVLNGTDAGELFIGSPGGSKFFVDPFMCYLAANDATGVWAFRDDGLLRVAGLNYQRITSGSYEEHLNDNGEYTEISGHCIYPWEAMGYFKEPTSDIITTKSNWEKGKERVFYYEPAEIDAKPFYRVLGLGGWLGQGKSTSIIAPSNSESVSKYGQKDSSQQALSRIAQNIDGLVTIESAKGVSIVKRSSLPAPQRLRDPSDAAKGDTKDNYDFSHKDVKVKGEPATNVSKTSAGMQSVMAIDDYRTYVTNYKPYAGLLGHKEEWYVPEESGSSKVGGSSSSWKSRELMDPPTPDSSGGQSSDSNQQYYSVEAGLHFLPDGGVVLHDGYGSEIRMACGQITISAPLGIWIRSGKDVRLWSGNDITMRSKNAMEMSTTSGSVRIKAEKHLEMIGGNDGRQSGVIIESRGQGEIDFSKSGDGAKMNGILLKAPDGVISTIGGTIYTRACRDGMQGSIMLDANEGKGNIYTSADTHINYVKTSHTTAFGDFKNKNVKIAQESTEDRFTIPGDVYCGGQAVFTGDIAVDGNISGGAHIATKGGADNPFVGGITGESKTAFDKSIKSVKDALEKTIPNMYKDSRSKTVEDMFYKEKMPGNEDVIKQSGFSFRTDDELKLDGFMVYADRWQTVCDVGSSTWKETKVTTETGEGEYPFPGKKCFESECYVTQPLALYENGTPKARMSSDSVADEYKNPKYKEPEVKSLNEYPLL